MTTKDLPAPPPATLKISGRSGNHWPLAACLVSCLVATALPLHAQDADDARARKLVSEMTLSEKIEELHGIQDKTHFRYVPPIPRLGIPALRVANGPAGVGPAGAGKQRPATALPAPISLAASWDVDLAKRYGQVIGIESRDLSQDLLEGPDVNITRVPQNGRTFETFGEDPYLAGQFSVQVIRGIQSQGIIANVKHFAANNQETDRFKINEIVGERALREIYLPAFEVSVKVGHVASLMGAYPKVNGSFNCENDELLNQILKKEWGFDGFVTSDFGAVHSTIPSAMNGLDLEMPTGIYFGKALEAAVESNAVPMSVIDDKLVRRFRTMMEFGMFDHPLVPEPIPVKPDGQAAREFADAGMVLLKNEHQELPLNATNLHHIAIIGPAAGRASTGGGGSSHVDALYTVKPVDGIQQKVGDKVTVDYADGKDLAQAVALARNADEVIVMVGDRTTEGRDHPIELSGNQNELIAAIAAVNPHTVVVLKTGSAVLMPWVDAVPAILEAWFPGEEDGNAVADILFGTVNPSGKLPMTFPRQLADVPANTPEQYPGVDGVAHYTEGIFVGYRHYDTHNIQPLFSFGHGLSYTTFAYSNLVVSPSEVAFKEDSAPVATVDFDVTNSGQRAGQEVVQLYIGFPATTALPQPPKQLKGFQKIALQPGETGHVHLELNRRSLACWNDAVHGWDILPGVYHLMVGSSSRNIRLQSQITVTDDHLLNGVAAAP